MTEQSTIVVDATDPGRSLRLKRWGCGPSHRGMNMPKMAVMRSPKHTRPCAADRFHPSAALAYVIGADHRLAARA